MDEHSSSHHSQFDGVDNLSPAPMNVRTDRFELSNLLGILRHPFTDSSNSGRPSPGIMSQSRPENSTHAAKVAVNESSPSKKPCWRGKTWRKKQEAPPITGQALEDRRRLAHDRIAQGGWKAGIAKMAIEYIKTRKWYNRPSKAWGVICFIKDAEALGELCTDWGAIRQFLDENIHRFIAFHAMEKDFKVPDYLIGKASQRRSVGDLKYPWLRSFIREYQGLGRTTAESLVQVYKDQGGDGHIADESLLDSAPVYHGGSVGRTITATPSNMAMNRSLGHEGKASSSQTCHMPLDDYAQGRKRQQTLDDAEDLDNCRSAKKVKRESTEDGLVESQDRAQEPDTCEVITKEVDHGKDMIHTKGRTLTVLFHGMKHDGDGESEHVQVYVPRTSKGVTINFL